MLRIEKRQHVCSVACCNTITECYMITKLSGYINAVYLCPDCAKSLALALDIKDVAKEDKKPTEAKIEPIKDTVEPKTVEAVVDIVEPVKIVKNKATKK